MESPEHERRHIIEYVEIEARGETVQRAEKIASEHVMYREYDVWDVQTDENRWWVITNMTNLYPFDDFKSMDQVLAMHIGLMERIMARQYREGHVNEEERDRLRIPWRKWEQAQEALEEADEAEEFQAVGMRCRETLLALIRAVATTEMVPAGEEAPQRANFLRWSDLIVGAIVPESERLRAYLRSLASSTWHLVGWLTHEANARQFDAILTVDATAYLLATFGSALVRQERGQPDRCPFCASYQVVGDYRSELDAYVNLCAACGWESGVAEGEHAHNGH